MTPVPDHKSRGIARYALGLWFCGIGVLGLLQFYLRAFEDGVFLPSTIAWLWLAGAALVIAIGVATILRAARRRD